MAPAPQYFIHAYVMCDSYEGELPHSCQHGEGPHRIKVCIIKKDNDPNIFKEIKSIIGVRPFYYKKKADQMHKAR